MLTFKDLDPKHRRYHNIRAFLLPQIGNFTKHQSLYFAHYATPNKIFVFFFSKIPPFFFLNAIARRRRRHKYQTPCSPSRRQPPRSSPPRRRSSSTRYYYYRVYRSHRFLCSSTKSSFYRFQQKRDDQHSFFSLFGSKTRYDFSIRSREKHFGSSRRRRRRRSRRGRKKGENPNTTTRRDRSNR
jgi:hypothetical protein